MTKRPNLDHLLETITAAHVPKPAMIANHGNSEREAKRSGPQLEEQST
jgi:hypothetical protein